MRWISTAYIAGLLLASANAVTARGQYSVSFKIVAGKLAVDRDTFHVPPALVKFEPAIRKTVRDEIKTIGPLAPNLLITASWPEYISAYEDWAAQDPSRLDLGTLFSSDFLFSTLLKDAPDSGLVLNDEVIDPASGTISFSILPVFDSQKLQMKLSGMPQRNRPVRQAQLRRRLARLNGRLWCSACIRQALAAMYANLGLTPQILILPKSDTIQIIEAPRINSIMLPEKISPRDIDRLLWELLDSRQFRMAMRNKSKWLPARTVDFDRDLGYAPGDEPYDVPYQIQELQFLISPLGYTVMAQPSARTGASQYVDLQVQPSSSSEKKAIRRLAAGFTYKPGQGVSAVGNLQVQSLTLSAGGPSGVLGSGAYSAQYLGYSAILNAFTSVELNRVLDHVHVDEHSTGALATLQWQPFRALDGNSLLLGVTPEHAVILNRTLNTIQPEADFVHNTLTSDHPWRATVSPRVLIDGKFANAIITANTHRAFDHWEYDLTGHFENAFGNAPIFELPSFGGENTVRGFRADDAIGRRIWSDQNELWHVLTPRWPMLKIAAFGDIGGAYQTTGSAPSLRAGTGAGLRLDFRVAVVRFDWAYGFGQAATGGSRGKFYFNVVLNNL